MARQTLEQWIKEATSDMDKDGMCSMISLVHMQGIAEKEIHTIRFATKQWTPRAAAELFRHKANGYAQDLPGVQTFNLLAFYGGRTEPEARHPFTVQGETEQSLATEGPHATGLVQQSMRHTEAMTQMALRSLASTTDTQGSLINMLSGMLQKSLQENGEMLEIFKTVIAEKAAGQHQYKMEEIKAQRSAAEREKWIGMLPALANTLLGKQVFPQASEDTALIETLAHSLNPKQIQAIASVLPPEVWAPLANRFVKILRSKEEQANEDERTLARIPNPELDAAGEN